MDRRAYIVQETVINAVINTVIGMLVFFFLFWGGRDVAIWGARGLVVDCLPQGFMVGVMSVVPPGVLTRIRVARGSIPGVPEPVGALARRALSYGIVTMVCLVALAAALALISGATRIGFGPGLTLKALAAAVLVAILTPPALRAGLDRMMVPAKPY